MKANRFVVNILKHFIKKDVKKRKAYDPPHSFKEWRNVPYVDDGLINHSYDVFLADESNRKHICVFDIHGGSYIFGEHDNNYPFAYELLRRGYDVVTMDYTPNNGKMDTFDLITDLENNFRHALSHLKDFDLDNDRFFIAGDSAGGHFALLFAELFTNDDIQKSLHVLLPELDFDGVILNCPVYDFENIDGGVMTKSGLKRMFGPKGTDKKYLATLSPKTYIDKITKPIFLSTCKHDFIRIQSLKLKEDVESRSNFVFVDVDSDDKRVDHVHNVVKINLKESIYVNNEIDKFIMNLEK